MLNILDNKQISEMAKKLFIQKRAGCRLDGWFIAKEKELALDKKFAGENEEIKKAKILREIVRTIPIDISEFNIFAGTQDDAFARSYALINPAFKVEEFQIEGNRIVSDDDIIALSGISVGDDIFQTNVAASADQIALHVMIDDVSVRVTAAGEVVNDTLTPYEYAGSFSDAEGTWTMEEKSNYTRVDVHYDKSDEYATFYVIYELDGVAAHHSQLPNLANGENEPRRQLPDQSQNRQDTHLLQSDRHRHRTPVIERSQPAEHTREGRGRQGNKKSLHTRTRMPFLLGRLQPDRTARDGPSER